MLNYRLLGVVLVLTLAPVACSPRIDTVAPEPALPGDPITIRGNGLGGPSSAISVLYDGSDLAVVSRSANEIDARLPADAEAGAHLVHVVVAGRPSNALPHTIAERWKNPTARADAFRLLYRERVERVLTAHNRALLVGDVVPAMTLGATFIERRGPDWELVLHPKDNNDIGTSAFNAYALYRIYRTRSLALTALRMFEGLVVAESVTDHPGLTSREWQTGFTLTIADGPGGSTIRRERDGAPVAPAEAFPPELEQEIVSTFFAGGTFVYRGDPAEYYFTAEPLFVTGDYAVTFVFSELPKYLRISDCCSSFMRTPRGPYEGYFWGNHNSRDNFPDYALGYLAASECAADTEADADLRASCARAAEAGRRIGDSVLAAGYNLMTVGELGSYDDLIVAGAVRPDGSVEGEDGLGSMNSCQMSYMAKALSTAGLEARDEVVEIPGSYEMQIMRAIFDLLGLPAPEWVKRCRDLDEGYFGLSWAQILAAQVNGRPVWDVIDDLLHSSPGQVGNLIRQIVGSIDQPEKAAAALVAYARIEGKGDLLGPARETLGHIVEMHDRLARTMRDYALEVGDPGTVEWARNELYRAATFEQAFGPGKSEIAPVDFSLGLEDAQRYEEVLARGDSPALPLLSDEEIRARVESALAGAPAWNQERYRARFPDAPPLSRAGDHYEAVGADGAFHAIPNLSNQWFGAVDLFGEAPLCAFDPDALECAWAALGCARPDLDASGAVDATDRALFDALWSTYGPPASVPCDGSNGFCAGADLDRSGRVTDDDLAFLTAAEGCWYARP